MALEADTRGVGVEADLAADSYLHSMRSSASLVRVSVLLCVTPLMS
jgi:hypothetical protein